MLFNLRVLMKKRFEFGMNMHAVCESESKIGWIKKVHSSFQYLPSACHVIVLCCYKGQTDYKLESRLEYALSL